MEQQHIDALLERYLTLIDEYSRLREELSKLQAGVYQYIARANFAGERGMRYGQDHYDERMRALRALDITTLGEDNVPVFAIKRLALAPPADDGTDNDECRGEDEKKRDTSVEDESAEATTATTTTQTDSTNTAEEKQKEDKEKDGKKTRKRSSNPLHWFGLLAPPALRTAQAMSVQAVEQVIPRLVSVNAEMEHVEIEIRRARKKRAKAEAAAAAAAAAAEKEALGEAIEAR